MKRWSSLRPSDTLRLATPQDTLQLRSLADRSEHRPLAYLDRFSPGISAICLGDDLVRSMERNDLLVIVDAEQIVAALPLEFNDDLTDHFSTPFFGLGPVAISAAGGRRYEHAAALFTAAGELVGDPTPSGVVTLRIEGTDTEVLNAAEAAGFRVMETTLTFINDLEHRAVTAPIADGRLSVYRLDQGQRPRPEEYQHLREYASGLRTDHYHADRRLDTERCDALYARLFDRVIAGIAADVLLIRHHEGSVVGFGSWKHWNHLDRFGLSVAGSGFGFRRPGPEGAGFAHAVAEHVCGEPVTGNRLLEWSTQATNASMVNVICHVPSIRATRTSYVLHRWTDTR